MPTAQADALFELAEAVLCTSGPVRSLVDLSLAPEHPTRPRDLVHRDPSVWDRVA
jgi:hypothetical protein